MDDLFSWLFLGLLVEIALILFFLFRLSRGMWPVRLLTASMGFFTSMMALMVGATFLGGGELLAFTSEDGRALSIAFVVLGVFAIALARVKEWGYANTPAGDRARARDALKPKKRKRPLIVDLLGCAVIGAVLIVLLGIAIVAGIGLFGRV